MQHSKHTLFVFISLLIGSLLIGLLSAAYAQDQEVTVKGKLLRQGSGWQIVLSAPLKVEHQSVRTLLVNGPDTKQLNKLTNKNVSITGSLSRPSAMGIESETLYVSSIQEVKASFMEKMQENAAYQQQQQAAGGSTPAAAPAKSNSNSQEDRAKYIEAHACLTTDGADKANELANDCKKVTSASNKACNIQENTCDEIRSTTQKGCWGLAASAPDFCMTKYR